MADSALAAYTDVAIAVSQSTADFVVNARKMPAEKTQVVYLGVPLEDPRVRVRRMRSPGPAPISACPRARSRSAITRLMPFKATPPLVQAFKSIFERVPNARGFIVGEGELEEALKAEARRLALPIA